MKRVLSLGLLMIMILALAACGADSVEPPAPATSEEAQTPVVQEEEVTLTLDELSTYDGLEGRKAYIAVDGVVYDVTDLSLWSGGSHNGYQAGADLTDAIKNSSPHGLSVLSRAEVVGSLVE